MRLRITKVTDKNMTSLRVDGELLGEGVRELARVAGATHPLRLDLANLLRADASGLMLLRRLAAAGAELVNPSPYIALRLKGMAGGR